MTSKQRQIIIKSLLWFITLFILIFVGVNNIFALTTKTIYSDLALSNSNKYNYGYTNAGGIDDVTTGTVGTRINGKTKYIGFYLSENTSLNYTYTIRINFLSDDLQPYFSLNYVRRIETCNSSSCSNASIIAIRKQNNNGYSTWIELDFNPTQVGSKIGVVLGNDNGNYITGETYFGISSVQIESKNANQDVINNATNNTNNIINNNNSNTENIINNQNSNNQAVIDNNNENTQKIIDENKKNFNDCRDSYNLFSSNLEQGSINSSGISSIALNRVRTSSFILIESNTQYTLSIKEKNILSYVFEYDSSYNFIDRIPTNWTSLPYTFTTNDNAKYIKVIFSYSNTEDITSSDVTNIQLQEGSIATDYEPYGEEICTNKLDEQNKTSKGILGKLGDLFNNLFSTDDADLSGLDNMVGWLPPGPLDSIINLPLTLFNSLTNTLSGTCNSVSLTLPFVNKNLTLPCFNTFMSQYLTGFSTVWTLIGSIVSIFILYNYLLSLYKWVDDTLTLRENNLPGYYDDNWGGGA